MRGCRKDEYRTRYKRGLVFYLQDDVVTGIVFWNLPWEKERLRVVKEVYEYTQSRLIHNHTPYRNTYTTTLNFIIIIIYLAS